MATFDSSDGIKVGSFLKNESSNFPIVNPDKNHLSGIGYFTSVGISGTDTDNNTSVSDTQRYLVNCPPAKRSLNFVAILDRVTTTEEAAITCFVESANPSVYIYKGPQAASGDISDSEWTNSNNWFPVGGGGTGDINIQVVGTNEVSGTDTVNFGDVAYRTNVSYGVDVNNNPAIVYTLPNDIAIEGASAIRLGDAADDHINGGGFADGLVMTSTGTIQSWKNGANTSILGNTVTSGTYNGAQAYLSSTVVVGDQGGVNSSMTTGQVKSNIGDFINLNNVSVFTGQPEGTKFTLTDNTSSHGHFRLGYGAPVVQGGIGYNGLVGGTPTYISTNSNLYFQNIPEQSTSEVLFVLAQDGNDQVKKVPVASVGGSTSVNITATQGVTHEYISADNTHVLKANPDVLSFLYKDQIMPVGKGIGHLEVTGNTDPAYSDIADGSGGLRILPNAIDQIDFNAPHNASAYKLLLRGSTGLVGIENGKVFEGPSISSLFQNMVEGGADITTSVNFANETIQINVDPVHIRKDQDDSSIYKVRTQRLSAQLYRQEDVEDALNSVSPEFSPLQVQDKVTETLGSSTIIEWVRLGEGGVPNPDYQDLRDSGVIMKSGFTAANAANSPNSIAQTKFRFSAKRPDYSEVTTQQEELSGTYSFNQLTTSISTYDGSNSDFAIQIGTGGLSSLGDRYNEVLIPNLTVGALSSDGPNYLAGGGTLGGDWNITGNLNIGGDLTIDGATIGGTSVDFAGTLLHLGMPQTGYGGNTSDTADIGFAGLFNWTDSDTDGELDNTEGQITAFFRDGSTPGSNTIYFHNDLTPDPADNRPYKLMTAITTTAAPSITQLNEVDGKTGYTPLEVGGLALKGWDLTDNNVSENHTTGYVNRITTRIQDAKNIEETLTDAWNAWADTSIPTTKAVWEHVNGLIGTITGFSSTSTDVFDYGITTGEIANASNTYTEGNADHIFVTSDGGASVSHITPEKLGLALDSDAGTSGRGQIGYMPESVELKAGTSLRAVLKKILTQYATPTITMDVNSELRGFFGSSDHYERVTENGVRSFGDQGVGTTIEMTIYNVDNLGSASLAYTTSSLDVTNIASGTGINDQSGIVLSDIISVVDSVDTGTPGQKTWSLDLDVDVDANDFNGVGDGPNLLSITGTANQGTLSLTGSITSFTDSNYFNSTVSSSSYIYVRRRSFYFVSDLNARASVAAGLSLDAPMNSYAAMDGTKNQNGGAAGFSNKLMHYVLCTMASGSGTELGVDSTNLLTDWDNNTLNIGSALSVTLGSSGVNPLTDSTSIRARSMINTEAGFGNAVGTGENWTPHASNATDIRQFKGMLAHSNYVIGGSQSWGKRTLSASDNGFYYIAIPKKFAGSGLDTDWYDPSLAEPFRSKFVQDLGAGEYSGLVLNQAGDAPETFTVTNWYGVEDEYVLWQGSQPGLVGTTGTFPNLIAN